MLDSRCMLNKVTINRKVKAEDFLEFVSDRDAKALFQQAEALRGKRIVHVNATEIGGGVAEILGGLIPYLRALGIESDWYVIDPATDPAFFSFTNKLHDALQGIPTEFSREEWLMYEDTSRKIAEDLKSLAFDVLAINDPQPLLAGSLIGKEKYKVYFSHIDTSNAHPPLWNKILPLVTSYDRVVFSNTDFVHTTLQTAATTVFTPAIDPLAAKQETVPRERARQFLERYGIPSGGPLIVQVSRFDVWKNPRGVIEAFQIVQKAHPDAQLALVGFNEAKDNPTATEEHRELAAHAAGLKNIFLFFDPADVDVLEFTVMAQNAADVIVQNSTREGFGLTVTEAMWKSKPVIGGPASGIRAQITNGDDGFIVTNSEELAERISYLLSHPQESEEMGKKARSTVIKKFLLPRLVLDHLNIYSKSKIYS